MDKFEFTEGYNKYRVVRESNNYRVIDGDGWACTYPINNDPTNWINKMIDKYVAKQDVNGTDAEGNPLHFTQDMLKPFMRVEQKSLMSEALVTYIVAADDNGLFLVNCEGWNNLGDFDRIKTVYAAPLGRQHAIDSGVVGRLIWRYTQPKTAEQLAQEKAVVERKAAIEEAEKALNQAQEALDKLKGSV